MRLQGKEDQEKIRPGLEVSDNQDSQDERRCPDPERFREEFGFFRQNDGVYFDNAATSLTPDSVIDAMTGYLREYSANVGRSSHALAKRATLAYTEAKETVARFVGCDPKELVFNQNATHGINQVAGGLSWERGDRVLITLVNHHSNYIPWLRLRETKGVEVDVVRPEPSGEFLPEAFERALEKRPKLVALTHVSNVLGAETPVKTVSETAHAVDALVLVDGAQSVPHMPVDLSDLNVDFLSFSGHKMLGPTGVGVLYVDRDAQDALEPSVIGGGTIKDVWIDGYELKEGAERYEGGTPNIAEAVGLAQAVRILEAYGLEAAESRLAALTGYLVEGLGGFDGIEVYGPDRVHARKGIVSFNIKGVSPHRAASLYDQLGGIMVRSGHHCALPLVKYLLNRPQGTVRASLYFYNTKDEVDRFLKTTEKIIQLVKK